MAYKLKYKKGDKVFVRKTGTFDEKKATIIEGNPETNMYYAKVGRILRIFDEKEIKGLQ
jgi:hypothetical protein